MAVYCLIETHGKISYKSEGFIVFCCFFFSFTHISNSYHGSCKVCLFLNYRNSYFVVKRLNIILQTAMRWLE